MIEDNPDLTLVDQEAVMATAYAQQQIIEISDSAALEFFKQNQLKKNAAVSMAYSPKDQVPKELLPVKLTSESRCSTLIGPHSRPSQVSSPHKTYSNQIETTAVQSPSKVVVKKKLVPVMPKQFQMSKYFSMQKGMGENRRRDSRT